MWAANKEYKGSACAIDSSKTFECPWRVDVLGQREERGTSALGALDPFWSEFMLYI